MPQPDSGPTDRNVCGDARDPRVVAYNVLSHGGSPVVIQPATPPAPPTPERPSFAAIASNVQPLVTEYTKADLVRLERAREKSSCEVAKRSSSIGTKVFSTTPKSASATSYSPHAPKRSASSSAFTRCQTKSPPTPRSRASRASARRSTSSRSHTRNADRRSREDEALGIEHLRHRRFGGPRRARITGTGP